MRSILTFLLASLLMVSASGCAGGGGSEGPKEGDRAPKPDTGPRQSGGADPAAGSDGVAEARGELVVRMTRVGSKDGAGIPTPAGLACSRSIPATCSARISCPAEEDTRQGRPEACAWLAGPGIGLLSAEPQDRMCTEQYGGPEVLTVAGEMNGTTIDARFTRTNGCEIERFDTVAPIYGGAQSPPAGAAPGQPVPQEMVDPPEAFE